MHHAGHKLVISYNNKEKNWFLFHSKIFLWHFSFIYLEFTIDGTGKKIDWEPNTTASNAYKLNSRRNKNIFLCYKLCICENQKLIEKYCAIAQHWKRRIRRRKRQPHCDQYEMSLIHYYTHYTVHQHAESHIFLIESMQYGLMYFYLTLLLRMAVVLFNLIVILLLLQILLFLLYKEFTYNTWIYRYVVWWKRWA